MLLSLQLPTLNQMALESVYVRRDPAERFLPNRGAADGDGDGWGREMYTYLAYSEGG